MFLVFLFLFQVIEQQQLLQTNQPSVLFNPETQTKIIYRVVYPSDIHRSGRGRSTVSRGRKRPHRTPDADVPGQDGTPADAKKPRHRRTRSGRVCRPPRHMVKDYRQISATPVDPEVETNEEAGGSDVESSGDEADGRDQAPKTSGGMFDFAESIPTGEIDTDRNFLLQNIFGFRICISNIYVKLSTDTVIIEKTTLMIILFCAKIAPDRKFTTSSPWR